MTVADVLMLGLAVLGGAGALLVVTARNVVHAALYLVVTLVAVAGTFLVLGAEFLAWAQVLIYVGAVVVLILFGLMLTRAPIGPMAQHNENGRLAFGVSVALFAFLTTVIMTTFSDTQLPLAYVPTGELGDVLYLEWAFPFMVLGFLLTVSLIGAIIIARREEGEGPAPPTEERHAERTAPAGAPEPSGTAQPGEAVTAGAGQLGPPAPDSGEQ